MMEYKRLKEKLETILTLPELPFEEDLTAVDCKQIYDILCKIEQGTLVELPCKVGDTVYVISNVLTLSIIETTIDKIVIAKSGLRLKLARNSFYETAISSLGERLFLTREEAEKRLKELKK